MKGIAPITSERFSRPHTIFQTYSNHALHNRYSIRSLPICLPSLTHPLRKWLEFASNNLITFVVSNRVFVEPLMAIPPYPTITWPQVISIFYAVI